MKNAAFLFPGQGAQHIGMGKDFFDAFSLARLIFEEAEDHLRLPLKKIIFEGTEKELAETKICQLAIFTVSTAISRVFIEECGLLPVIVAGLSLGEYTALLAAGKISYKEALEIVQKRAFYMNEACELNKGTMAAVLGLSAEEVKAVVAKANLPNDLFVANYNCPGQTVISGALQGIEAGSILLKEAGARRILPLQVHGAFHSGLMKPAKDLLAPFIKEVSLKESSVPIVMNVTALLTQDLQVIRDNLINQVVSSVCWEQSIKTCEARAFDCYVEFGPGKTLSGMNKKIGVERPTVSIATIDDLQTFQKQLKESL